jgi:hypothetical protein
MNAVSLDREIKQYLPLLEITQKQSLLSQIKSFLKIKDEPILTKEESLLQYNKELEEAEARIDAGHFTTIEEAMKQAESW